MDFDNILEQSLFVKYSHIIFSCALVFLFTKWIWGWNRSKTETSIIESNEEIQGMA